MPFLLGVDIGTTHIKACIFDVDGHQEARAIVPTSSIALPDGGAVYEPEVLWAEVCSVIREACAWVNKPSDIAGVAVASMGEAGLPLDREGNPLYPIISWFDPRTGPLADRWRENVGPEKTSEITGLRIHHIYSAFKLMWLFQNEPAIMSKAARWLNVADFINFRLTGEQATDYSLASRTMLFDQRTHVWSTELLSCARIPPELMPRPVPGGSLVGKVTEEAHLKTGLAAGTPVYAGGHDHVCGALASGIIEPGLLLDSCGTAESVLTVVTSPDAIPDACANGFSLGSHVVRDRFCLQGGIMASGGTVDWFAREFGWESPPAGGAGSHPTESLMRCARESPTGARGLLFLPHLRGSGPPTRDPLSKGAFLGISLHHKRCDFARAVIEGLAFEFRTAIAAAERAVGTKLNTIRAIGGGTYNSFWLQTKADVTGMEIEVPEVSESTALGAALLAGIGAGIYEDAASAVRATYRMRVRFEPDPQAHSIYCKIYPEFEGLYSLLKPLNHRLEGNR